MKTLLMWCFSIIVSVFPAILIAQEPPPPMEWGEVPKDQLVMTSFPADSNATAVILCDFGETHLNDELGLVYTRHRRIKILTKAGFDWASHSVVVYTDDHMEKIDQIEGVTYTLGPDGAIKETEMDDDAIFEEDVDGKRTRIRFTLPALTPGCVVEYKYRIVSRSLFFIRNWEFQTSEPVLWSEYRVVMPPQISYSGVTHGYESYTVNENTTVTRVFHGETSAYLQAEMARCNQFRWALANAPALREEPYMTTTDDYINKVSLQLAGYALGAGAGIQRVLKDWPTVAKELLDASDFGRKIDVTGDVERTVGQVTAGLTSPQEKMKAIYDFVRKNIVWSGLERVFGEQDVDNVLETKKGNSADITFLLLSMLRSAGISCSPIILSTRSNGSIQKMYPIINQFNYVLCMATIGGQPVFLDATDPIRPMGLLPPKVLNVEGLAIQEGSLSWVRLASPKQYVHKSIATIALHEDGTLDGVLESRDDDYSALDKRRGLKDKNEVEIVKEAFNTDETGIAVDSVRVSGRDSIDAGLTLWAHVSSDQYASAAGNLIYINPFVIDRKKTNPFKLRVRKFPVDMAYGTRTITAVNIQIPRGFVMHDQLPDRTVTMQSDAITYTRKCLVDNGRIQVVGDLMIKGSYFAPNDYQRLRSFYAEMVSLQNDQIVLQRASSGSPK